MRKIKFYIGTRFKPLHEAIIYIDEDTLDKDIKEMFSEWKDGFTDAEWNDSGWYEIEEG